MKKVNLVITWILLLLSFSLAAQDITIQGTITDSSGELVIGANILVKGTTNGTISDYNGQYKLTVKVGDTVEYMYIGYRSHQEVITNTRTVYNVVLQDDDQILEEVVVVGYGVEKKMTLVGSMASISSSYNPYDYGIGRIDYDKLQEEEYNKLGENKFKSVHDEPVSTFSSDVDKASYSNMRRFLNQNMFPDPDAIRTEELVNYFHYDYGQPTDEHPILINGEIGKCPWNPSNVLCRIGIKTKDIPTEDLPPSNFVFLIDVSGSMYGPTRLGLVKSSLNLLIDNMQPHDKIAIVVYAGNAGLVLPSTSGEQKEVIKESLNRLEAGGSTAGGAGIKLAYKVAKENFISGGNNRIILCTDGDFNVGVSSNKDLEKLIEEERESGVFLTVLGYGMGNYKDSKLQTLAQKGNGNHAYIDSEEEANRVLVIEAAGTLYLVAKDVKIQVEFNPGKVAKYRLIGYETRLLENEDFDDDLKDAGDMGSGHTVTAFYEIVPAKGAKLEKKDEIPWLTFNMRYKHPESDTSQLLSIPVLNNRREDNSSDFKFASAVVMFSQLLRNSEFKGKSTYKEVLNLAQANIGEDEHGYRTEFLDLVKKAQKVPKTVVQKRLEKPIRNPLQKAPEFYPSDFNTFYEKVNGEAKMGMEDEDEKIVVPALYDDVVYLIGGVFLVENDDKYGLYHYSKGLIVPLKYDDIDNNLIDGYLSVENKDKYGVIDITGREIVPVQYDDVEEEYGYFLVEKNDKYGLYTQTGKQIIPVIYDDVEVDDYAGFIIVEKNDKYGWYSIDGKQLTDAVYDDEPDRLVNNFFLISKNDKEGLIDENGKIIIPCKYEDIDDLTPHIFVVEIENDKMGAYSSSGKQILKAIYDDIDLKDVPEEWEEEGYLELEKNDRYGVASPNGKIIVPCKYDDVDIAEYEENGKVTDFFFIVEKNDKYGLISKTGKVIIPVRYDDLDDEFVDGLIEAEKGDKTYFFNRAGKLVKKE